MNFRLFKSWSACKQNKQNWAALRHKLKFKMAKQACTITQVEIKATNDFSPFFLVGGWGVLFNVDACWTRSIWSALSYRVELGFLTRCGVFSKQSHDCALIKNVTINTIMAYVSTASSLAMLSPARWQMNKIIRIDSWFGFTVNTVWIIKHLKTVLGWLKRFNHQDNGCAWFL